jgi:hypothetical protein
MGPRWRGPFADARFRRLLAGQSLSTFGDTALYLMRRRPLLSWTNAPSAIPSRCTWSCLPSGARRTG